MWLFVSGGGRDYQDCADRSLEEVDYAVQEVHCALLVCAALPAFLVCREAVTSLPSESSGQKVSYEYKNSDCSTWSYVIFRAKTVKTLTFDCEKAVVHNFRPWALEMTAQANNTKDMNIIIKRITKAESVPNSK